MSDLLKRYEESQKLRVKEARAIPGQKVNFVDIQNIFQDQFKTFQRKGDPTSYTNRALQYFDEEQKQLTPPDGFVRLENDIPLNRWNENNKYYNPGQPQS